MTDPRTKLIGVILVGFLAITMENPVLLGVIALLSASALVRSGLTPQWWKRALTLAAFIAWGTVLSQGLFFPTTRVPWIQIGVLMGGRHTLGAHPISATSGGQSGWNRTGGIHLSRPTVYWPNCT